MTLGAAWKAISVPCPGTRKYPVLSGINPTSECGGLRTPHLTKRLGILMGVYRHPVRMRSVFVVITDEWKREITIDNKNLEVIIMISVLQIILLQF